MKQVREYSAKEISIFEGIYALLNQGRQLHELKVSDIAAAAGMGKGTVYEYFSSKDEIIRQALGYHIMREVELFFTLVFSEHAFAGMISSALDYVIDAQTRYSALMSLVLTLDQPTLKQLAFEDCEMHAAIHAAVNENIGTMIKAGRKEKLIGENVTTADCRLVLNGMMTSFYIEARSIQSEAGLGKSQPVVPSTLLSQTNERLSALKSRTLQLILKALK